jgi:AraC-like DNA-binding protein
MRGQLGARVGAALSQTCAPCGRGGGRHDARRGAFKNVRMDCSSRPIGAAVPAYDRWRGCSRSRDMSIMQTVLRSPSFTVIDQVCRPPRVNCGRPDGDEPAHFLFTRRGSFAVSVGSRTCYARPGKAVLVQKHADYRIAHPDAAGCDCCTDVRVHESVLDSLGLAAAPACREIPHDLEFQKAHLELWLGLRGGSADTAEWEDLLFDALGCLLEGGPALPLRPSRASRPLARVEEAIIAQAGENLRVEQLAALAGYSPFHLCRMFRARTGQSLRQFRLQQRLGTALGRLADGEDDLAALACDLGFSSHSHMTAAFHRLLGRSPHQLRDELRDSDLRRLQARLRSRRRTG